MAGKVNLREVLGLKPLNPGKKKMKLITQRYKTIRQYTTLSNSFIYQLMHNRVTLKEY
jgi:hypothetical protein